MWTTVVGQWNEHATCKESNQHNEQRVDSILRKKPEVYIVHDDCTYLKPFVSDVLQIKTDM